jgi:hypothetical protein
LFVTKAFAALAMISQRIGRQQTQRNAGDTWAAKLPTMHGETITKSFRVR